MIRFSPALRPNLPPRALLMPGADILSLLNVDRGQLDYPALGSLFLDDWEGDVSFVVHPAAFFPGAFQRLDHLSGDYGIECERGRLAVVEFDPDCHAKRVGFHRIAADLWARQAMADGWRVWCLVDGDFGPADEVVLGESGFWGFGHDAPILLLCVPVERTRGHGLASCAVFQSPEKDVA